MKTRTIEVSEETYEKMKTQFGEELKEKEVNGLSDFVGEKLFIRTVTYHHVGEVVKVNGSLMELKGASWVADSGRFMNAIKNGELDEVEPVGRMFLNIDSIVDIFPWNHNLPKDQK